MKTHFKYDVTINMEFDPEYGSESCKQAEEAAHILERKLVEAQEEISLLSRCGSNKQHVKASLESSLITDTKETLKAINTKLQGSGYQIERGKTEINFGTGWRITNEEGELIQSMDTLEQATSKLKDFL